MDIREPSKWTQNYAGGWITFVGPTSSSFYDRKPVISRLRVGKVRCFTSIKSAIFAEESP